MIEVKSGKQKYLRTNSLLLFNCIKIFSTPEKFQICSVFTGDLCHMKATEEGRGRGGVGREEGTGGRGI